MLELLVENGAAIDVMDGGNGWTPLHEAVYYKRIESARILINGGADVNKEDRIGWSPKIMTNLPFLMIPSELKEMIIASELVHFKSTEPTTISRVSLGSIWSPD